MTIEIPPGLTELLQGFIVEVLRKRPPDLVDFAVQYFNHLQGTGNQEGTGTGGATGTAGEPKLTEVKREDDDESGLERELMLVFHTLRPRNKTSLEIRPQDLILGLDIDSDYPDSFNITRP